jgi:hypothetical protein
MTEIQQRHTVLGSEPPRPFVIVDARAPGATPPSLQLAGYLSGLCRAGSGPLRHCLTAPAMALTGGHPHPSATDADAGWDPRWDSSWDLGQRAARVIVVIDDAPDSLASSAQRLERHTDWLTCELRRIAYIPREQIALVMAARAPSADAVAAARARLRAYDWWGTIDVGDTRPLTADHRLLLRLGHTDPAALDPVPAIGIRRRRRLPRVRQTPS